MGAVIGALCTKARLVQCASLKSNMGHLEASAAVAGLSSLALVPLGESMIAVNSHLNRLVAYYAATFVGKTQDAG